MSEHTPSILRSSQAAAYLQAQPQAMRRLTRYLHTLELPDDQHRFALPYLASIKHAFSQRPNYKSPIPWVRSFAETELAKRAIEDGEAELEIDLRHARKHLPLGELAAVDAIRWEDLRALLNLSSTAIARWQKTKSIEIVGDTGQLYLGETALRSALVWRRPQDFPGRPSIEPSATRYVNFMPDDL